MTVEDTWWSSTRGFVSFALMKSVFSNLLSLDGFKSFYFFFKKMLIFCSEISLNFFPYCFLHQILRVFTKKKFSTRIFPCFYHQFLPFYNVSSLQSSSNHISAFLTSLNFPIPLSWKLQNTLILRIIKWKHFKMKFKSISHFRQLGRILA